MGLIDAKDLRERSSFGRSGHEGLVPSATPDHASGAGSQPATIREANFAVNELACDQGPTASIRPVRASARVANRSAAFMSALPTWTPSTSDPSRVRIGGSGYKLNFDLHRAGGLWLWAMLFVFAWSSVGFNLTQVHTPVMRAIFAFRDAAELPTLPKPKPDLGLGWSAALDRGRSLMAAELQAHGLTRRFESGLYHDAATGTFHYSVSSSADRADKKYGATAIVFDADTGASRDFSSPLDDRAGDTVTRWMYDLHMAAI